MAKNDYDEEDHEGIIPDGASNKTTQTTADYINEIKHQFRTGLSDAQRERLAWLAEECGEVIQAVGKILRHGYGDESTMYNNRADLEKELGHVSAAGALLLRAGDIKKENVIAATEEKKVTVRQFLHFQK